MKKFLFSLSICFVLSLFLSCSNNEKKNIIKIGAILDQTGPNAVYGKQVKDGLDIAIEQINSTGGINGKQLEVIFDDGKGDTKNAVGIANKFMTIEKVNLLIGEIGSNVTAAMIPVVEKNNGFLFAPASSSPKLSNISPNFARNWPSDDAEAGAAANFVTNEFKAKTASIIFVNSDYGVPLKDKFIEIFKNNGGKVLASETYKPGETNFKVILSKINISKPECIYLAGNPKEMGICVKQIGELKLNVKIISNTGFIQDECLVIAGKTSEGIVVPTPAYDPKDSANSYISKFGGTFFSKHTTYPNMVNANAYDALFLLKDAIEKVGENPIKIASYIRNKKNFSGAAGNVSFVNGEVQSPIIYKIIQNGKPVPFLKKQL